MTSNSDHALVFGAICFSGGLLTTSARNDPRLIDIVVAAHVGSLQVGHAVDVASSVRYTVKPWFQGKLDFAPQVVDLSNEGFRIHGGRSDYLTDRPVAALFYYRRSHAINLFIWPASADREIPVRISSSHCFHLRNWARLGMTYWLVSDLNGVELDQFLELLKNNQPQGFGNGAPPENPIR